MYVKKNYKGYYRKKLTEIVNKQVLNTLMFDKFLRQKKLKNRDGKNRLYLEDKILHQLI
jgi:hypothetical protein